MINEKLGGMLSPVPDAVAKAYARQRGLRVLMSEALAANVLGLSTQVPAAKVFLTDGPARKLQIGDLVLVFRHAAPKTMALSSSSTGIVIQALRHLGKDGVDDAAINLLRNRLTDREKQNLMADLQHAPDWLRPVVARIVEDT